MFNKDVGEVRRGDEMKEKQTDLYKYWCSFEVQTDWANIV